MLQRELGTRPEVGRAGSGTARGLGVRGAEHPSLIVCPLSLIWVMACVVENTDLSGH